jgi:putative ABC transport system substrate-binding protein
MVSNQHQLAIVWKKEFVAIKKILNAFVFYWQYFSVRNFFAMLLIAVCLQPLPSVAVNQTEILIITSLYEEPYIEAILGFKKSLSRQRRIKFDIITMPQAITSGKQKIESLRPQLIFTVGSNAAEWASRQTSAIPIVATLCFDSDIFDRSANVTGVKMLYSLSSQFEWLKQVFPNRKHLGYLYNPKEHLRLIDALKKIGHREGFRLTEYPVDEPKELPVVLDQISENIDLLLAIPDQRIISTQTIEAILLTSFRKKIPLIGFSDNWARSGALYGISWEYDELGMQSADIAKRLLRGVPVSAINPEAPSRFNYSVNTTIARRMNISIPPSVINHAKFVYGKFN